MPKLLIFNAFTLLIRKKNVANYALLQCKTFSLKIWLCKILDKYHVWGSEGEFFRKRLKGFFFYKIGSKGEFFFKLRSFFIIMEILHNMIFIPLFKGKLKEWAKKWEKTWLAVSIWRSYLWPWFWEPESE